MMYKLNAAVPGPAVHPGLAGGQGLGTKVGLLMDNSSLTAA